jgi:hypothetical protein
MSINLFFMPSSFESMLEEFHTEHTALEAAYKKELKRVLAKRTKNSSLQICLRCACMTALGVGTILGLQFTARDKQLSDLVDPIERADAAAHYVDICLKFPLHLKIATLGDCLASQKHDVRKAETVND